MTHSFYAVMRGYAVIKDSPQMGSATMYHVLDWHEVQEILKNEPGRVPDISEEHILARSQSDTLSKLIALAQIFSFCITCISRRAEGLSLSVLEISTIGYAACAIIAYFLWWKKPRIMTEASLIEKKIVQIDKTKSDPDTPPTNEDKEDDSNNRPNASNECLIRCTEPKLLDYNKYWGPVNAIGGISPMVYGLLHLLAWNNAFPTQVELILWRTSTIAVIASCIPMLLYGFIGPKISLTWFGIRIKLEHLFLGLFFIMYVPTRLFMLVEAFRQLWYLPPNAYQVTSWSNYLPQFS